MVEENQKEHDCTKCDQVKSEIEVNRVEPDKCYNGTLNMNESSFAYLLRFNKDISQIKNIDDLKNGVELTLADADGKAMTLDEKMNEYFVKVVGTAIAQFEITTQMTKRIAGQLEQMLGGKIEVPNCVSYNGCIPSNDNVKKFLQDYNARGQKA